MKQEDFNAALAPKIRGTINLNNSFASADLGFFIMMSSLASILGGPGQTNYVAGNSFQDSFAHAMNGRSIHTKYISINLGAVKGSDVIRKVSIRGGMITLSSAVFMSFDEMWMVLDYAMGVQGRADNCTQEILGFNRESLVAADDRAALENPLFCQMPLEHKKKFGGDNTNKVNLSTMVKSATTLEEVENIITGAILAKCAVFMKTPIDEISINESLVNVGLDSLVSIEFKNWMVRTFQVALQTSEVVGNTSVLELAKLVASRSQLVSGELRVTQNDGGR
jgi:hypothetical protein